MVPNSKRTVLRDRATTTTNCQTEGRTDGLADKNVSKQKKNIIEIASSSSVLMLLGIFFLF